METGHSIPRFQIVEAPNPEDQEPTPPPFDENREVDQENVEEEDFLFLGVPQGSHIPMFIMSFL